MAEPSLLTDALIYLGALAPNAPLIAALDGGGKHAFVAAIDLRRGSVLRVPGGDEIAAMNQSEATSEVHRQMESWRGNSASAPSGHLRLVTPGAGSGTGVGD